MVILRRRARVEHLDQVLAGARDRCTTDHQVRQLASLATALSAELTVPRLEEGTRDRLRTRLLADIHDEPEPAAATTAATPVRSPRRTLIATAVAAAIIGTSGVAVAARGALPGDALYGLKQAAGSVRVSAAGDHTERGRIELALAEQRLEDLAQAVRRGDVRDDTLVDTLARMDTHTRDGATTLVRLAADADRPELLDEVTRFTERQYAGLVETYGRLPVEVRPHADASLTTLLALRDLARGAAAAVGEIPAASRLPALEDLSPPPAPAPTTGADPTGTSSTPDDTARISRSPADDHDGTDADDVDDVPGRTEREVDDAVEATLEPAEEPGGMVDQVLDGAGAVLDGDDEDGPSDTGGPVDDTVAGIGDATDDTVGGVTDAGDDVGGSLDP